MAPSLVTAEPVPTPVAKTLHQPSKAPLQLSGALSSYPYVEATPVIGREYGAGVQLRELLQDDAKIRDLAITISQRGVVFFRNQDITAEEQKILGQKLGELTGKPETSKLHKHALLSSQRNIPVDDKGTLDDEISVISSELNRQLYADRFKNKQGRFASVGWHADITFERIPSDYAILKIQDTPPDGGDTLWASGYEAYDKLSPIWQKFAENLTATHRQPAFIEAVKRHGITLIEKDRGAPENSDLEFTASHPVIRTNPVTGWKSLFAAGQQVEHGWIDGVTEPESDILKEYFWKIISENHDLQVRFKWGVNDLAIWDNRSVFHTATNDYEGARKGIRVVSLGEKPYYDPASKSRREALERN